MLTEKNFLLKIIAIFRNVFEMYYAVSCYKSFEKKHKNENSNKIE